MGRRRVVVGLLAAGLVLGGCGDLIDELELSDEQASELEQFEDLVEEAAEAAQEAQDGGGDGGQPEFESDPNWSPPALPPPPDLEPDISLSEESDCDGGDCFPCEDGQQCGYAEYGDEDLEDVLDHYEDVLGRPPDDEVVWGSEDRTDYRWRDDDVFVEVSDNRDDGEAEVFVAQDDG